MTTKRGDFAFFAIDAEWVGHPDMSEPPGFVNNKPQIVPKTDAVYA